MSKSHCIECGTKKKLFSFNYAGFDIRGGDFHSFPERIQAGAFPGSKDDHFLCADCANKREVSCSVHGRLDDYFALGVPPRCAKCKEEVSLNNKDAKIQSFWAKQYPEAEGDIHLKVLYTRGALACSLSKSDGKTEQSEIDTVLGLFASASGDKAESEYKAFSSGFNAFNENAISNAQILENCIQFEDEETNRATLQVLFQIAAADGYLDKGEYDFIRKVSDILGFTLPEFGILANSLELKTSDFQKDELIAKAKTFGLGALAIGGAALKVLLEESDRQVSSKNTDSSKSEADKKYEYKYHKSDKFCVTCRNWTGVRTFQPRNPYVYTESGYTKGSCMIVRAPTVKYPTNSCRDWLKFDFPS